MKKRLRLSDDLAAVTPLKRRKVFADEEAIETWLTGGGKWTVLNRRKVFADEEAIETMVTVGRNTPGQSRRKVFADEEAIETPHRDFAHEGRNRLPESIR